jgi:GTP cyclohydrolase I
VTIKAITSKIVWFEELIEIAENASSAPLYTLMKREDEKFITEKAYNNPRFVEDTAREAALSLSADPRVLWYSVEVKNFESIHNHNAYACVKQFREE